MSDLIRQSVSWPYVHGARSYSRVTQLAPNAATGSSSSEKTETDRPGAARAESGSGGGGDSGVSRRGSLLDLSV